MVQCPSCGLRNDPRARFCRNCGLPLGWAQDPVRGTTTRRADLPGERGSGVASVIGLVAAVVVVVIAAFLILRPGGGGTALATRTPGASVSPTPAPPTAQGSPETIVPGSQSPGTTPSVVPSEPVSTGPLESNGPPGTSINFTCDRGVIVDPTTTKWKISHIDWDPQADYDEIRLTLRTLGSAIKEGEIEIDSMSSQEVAAMGANPPNAGDRAVVVHFNGRFTGFDVSESSTTMSVIPTLSLQQITNGDWVLVLAANGEGCHRMGVEAWSNNPGASQVLMTVDVQK